MKKKPLPKVSSDKREALERMEEKRSREARERVAELRKRLREGRQPKQAPAPPPKPKPERKVEVPETFVSVELQRTVILAVDDLREEHALTLYQIKAVLEMLIDKAKEHGFSRR